MKSQLLGLHFLGCGGRTRTCDLQVMSLASYQLLHSAMLRTCDLQVMSLASYQLLHSAMLFLLSGCKGKYNF